jgi:hypothetical protein
MVVLLGYNKKRLKCKQEPTDYYVHPRNKANAVHSYVQYVDAYCNTVHLVFLFNSKLKQNRVTTLL